MDFLLELFFGLFFELPMEAAMESKHIKTWVKTSLVALLCGLLVALIVWAARMTWLDEGWSFGTVFLCGFALMGLLFSFWFCFDGHRRNWHQDKPF